MKKFWLVTIIILGFARFCFADVTAEIIGIDKDEQGNIRVKTQYVLDGVEVKSNYPPLDGKYYWVTRYTVQNFAGMTKPQILARIKKDIQAFEQHLIIQKYMAINNNAFIASGQDLVNATDTQATASVYVDTNGDNILDTEWILKSDGTKTEKIYTPPIP